jgi:hypothetical protein
MYSLNLKIEDVFILEMDRWEGLGEDWNIGRI